MKCLGDFGEEDLDEASEMGGWGPKITIGKKTFKKLVPKVTIAPIKVKLPKDAKGILRDAGKLTGNIMREINPLQNAPPNGSA